MARKSIPSINPIRRIRLENGKTLEHFAFECGIGLQAVYLNECGVYPGILPSILKRLIKYYEQKESELSAEYEKYVREKRYIFGEKHKPFNLGDSNQFKSPILSFRELLKMSRIGFAKSVCVQPTLLYKVEEGKVDGIPGQLIFALQDIQLPVGDIQELRDRYEEFRYCVVR